MSFRYLFIYFAIICVVSAANKTYKGYKLYKAIPKDDIKVDLLKNVQSYGLGEFWVEDFTVNQDVQIMVSPQKNIDFIRFMTVAGIDYKEVIADIQKAINDQLKPADTRSSQPYLSFSWTEYHNLDRIYTWLDELEQAHPGIVTTVVMGRTVLGNSIKGIVINYNPGRNNTLIGVLEGTLHAREWITAATVTWIIKEFLTSTDPQVRALAENFEWHIFPVVNPDGYRYTFTDNRMWRKNRNPASFTSCESSSIDNDMSKGVDLNRNFDFEWMTVGASADPCSNLYAGPGPFSELESRAIRDYVLRLKDEGEIIYYIAFHSYTQLIIMPYSNVLSAKDLPPGNYADMFEVAVRGADALKKRFGTEYRVGLSADVLYPMSGTSFDWVKYATNVPLTFLIELRDLGEFGFLLPPSQIIPTAIETMDAFLEMDRTTRNLGYYSSQTKIMYSFVLITAASIFLVLFR